MADWLFWLKKLPAGQQVSHFSLRDAE